MRHRVLLAFVVLVLSAAGSPAAFGVEITITSGGVRAGAADSFDPPGGTLEGVIVTELPDSGEVIAIEGESRASTTFSLSNDEFDFVFDDFREAGQGGSNARSIAELWFIPSEDVGYSFAGAYASDSAEGGGTQLDVVLFDITDTTTGSAFISRQTSLSTPLESFILGQLGGDTVSNLFGSPTGTLVGGHEYVLTVFAGVGSGVGAFGSARGTGFVALTFVPEPSVGLLLLGGFASLIGVARR